MADWCFIALIGYKCLQVIACLASKEETFACVMPKLPQTAIFCPVLSSTAVSDFLQL